MRNYNRGKRGLGIDLKNPAGHAAFLDMARHADVVIDNYRRGVRERLGIDYEALRAVNPRIISCSINAYGEATGLAHQPGFDPIFQARSGMMSAQGGAGQEPVFHSVAINDVATAGMVAFAVIAALNARERTGLGQNITTSLAAQSALFQSGDLTTWPPGRLARTRSGVRRLACARRQISKNAKYGCGQRPPVDLQCSTLDSFPGVAGKDSPRD